MSTSKCSRCIGISLFSLSICAIVSNLLLYFPNGQVLDADRITDLVWFFHGILGAGILILLPAFMMLGAGGEGCCGNRCGMLLSVLFAVLGAFGGVYCVIISSLGLINGPLCDIGDEVYIYPFRNSTFMDNYLFNQTTWSICKKPENIILWNVVLFSLLLAIGMLEAVLCFIQVVNGLLGCMCGTCVRKRKTNVAGM
ncbi:PREDICTED: transmembrane 4 L6 family member 1-like [Gekko japonicus]|uniref:Transmembrane 4 L6 family member 1-like n=1 Tax=Gekko japonicus TaxID=146911 RepID=A0ABM1JWD3_GEKJA|nr:PREDICTED: transmembrane 4 L6 family member 1-like [Gekko japonicus]